MGNILLVSVPEMIKIAVIYSLIGAVHFFFRRQFLMISKDSAQAFQKGLKVRAWDFLFYVTFGMVVTSSVRIAGVLLVFSFLVVPPVCAIIFSEILKVRLILGWCVGGLASILGMVVSYYFDFPTGASVVCVLGGILIAAALGKKVSTVFTR